MRVCADIGSSGIWDAEPGVQSVALGDMLEYADLGLPDELVNLFEAWSEMLWQGYEAGVRPALAEPERYPEPQPVTRRRFFEEGRQLAIALKRFLGPKAIVYYWTDENETSVDQVEAPAG